MDDDEYYGFCSKHPANEPEPETREYFVLLHARFSAPGGYFETGWVGTMMLDPAQTKKDQYWEVLRVWNAERRKEFLSDLPTNALITLYHVVPNEPDVLPGTETEA